MNSLSGAKQEAVQALQAAGITAYDQTPKTLGPNCVVVESGSPYVEAGSTFDRKNCTIRLDLAVIGNVVSRDTTPQELDYLICEVIEALDDWDFEFVSQPGDLTWGQAIYFAATVTVTASINITKEVI